jgi:hypothetical protein
MSTKTYFGSEFVREFVAHLWNNDKTHQKYSDGAQLNPKRPETAYSAMESLLNWMTYIIADMYGRSTAHATEIAKEVVEYVFNNPGKVNLHKEWRQHSWWAHRIIDEYLGKPTLMKEDVWDFWTTVKSIDKKLPAPIIEKEETGTPQEFYPGALSGQAPPQPRPLPQKATLRPQQTNKQYPPGCEDENTLLGFLYRTLDHGMSKVKMQEDDGKVISILLSGPAGVGKTWSVQHIGETYFNAKVFVITAGQRVTDYLGYSDATGVYHASSLILALEYAQAHPDQLVIIMLDELDMTPPDVSGVLFSVLASRRLETLHTGFKMFPKNCTFVAAMNTIGNGADEDFVGRTPVDKAMLDRFVFPFNAYFEEATARKLCKDDALVDLALDWNQACHESNLTKMVLSYRHLNAAQMALDAGFSYKYALGKIVMAQSRNDLDTIFSNLKSPKTKYAKIIEECIQAVPVR